MAKMEGIYIWVAYKNVFGHISTNFWPSFMIQRPTIREKCVWVRSSLWRDERPVFFGFLIFRQTSQLATENFQNLCNCNWWSSLMQLGSVQFRSFFQSSKLDLRTLPTALHQHITTSTEPIIHNTDSHVFFKTLFFTQNYLESVRQP